ncbi:hypothetical protein INR49_002854 [Caranx melampygus]|nr:hypothetical protein INR49_002854 [Caranx melampygus]
MNEEKAQSAENVSLFVDGFGKAQAVTDVVLTLEPNWSTFFTGESVTFICDVKDGEETDWDYRIKKDNRDFFWYRSNKRFILQPLEIGYSAKYQCFAHHKRTYEEKRSNIVSLTVSAKPKAQLRADVREIPAGGNVTLTCSVNPSSGWKYDLYRDNKLSEPLNPHDAAFKTSGKIRVSQTGVYRCRGGRGDPVYYTEDSQDVRIVRIVPNRAVVTLEPNWPEIYRGEKITVSCEIQGGWKFFWSKAVPDPSQLYYSSELLPGSSNGTEQDSYMVHDVDPSASLTVSPDSAQHFSRDSVSLSCEGNSTKWRVKRSVGSLSHCSYWGEMTGSKCNIYSLDHTDAVYWCESGSGEFSNAVNFTTRYNGVILVSPVHPVAEGESITLRCKMRSEGSASYLFFYKDDKLIQNDTREELTIPAVSKSHEGFYKCGGKGRLRSSQSKMSPESWLSVKSVSRPENSSYSVPLIVGLVFGLLLIILLLLLFRCTKSKDSCFNRSQSTSQSSATDQTSKQDLND